MGNGKQNILFRLPTMKDIVLYKVKGKKLQFIDCKPLEVSLCLISVPQDESKNFKLCHLNENSQAALA